MLLQCICFRVYNNNLSRMGVTVWDKLSVGIELKFEMSFSAS